MDENKKKVRVIWTNSLQENKKKIRENVLSYLNEFNGTN